MIAFAREYFLAWIRRLRGPDARVSDAFVWLALVALLMLAIR